MNNFIKSLLIIILMILLQLPIYTIFLKPMITTWGASKQEILMPMMGDNEALTITSTRAITINAAKADVWQWLIQLGADRNGFYSYDFIEKALGYETRQQEAIKPEFKTIVVGDFVRGSIDEQRSIIPYRFRVRMVKPNESFVLDNWGTFLLKEVNSEQTRLIIRTQARLSNDPWLKVANFIVVPLHFIMERRTLMGIKARVEAGENVHLSNREDIAWFLGIVLSGILLGCYIFISRGILQSIIMPFVFSSSWLCTLLLLKPIPFYSIGLLLMVSVAIVPLMRKKTF